MVDGFAEVVVDIALLATVTQRRSDYRPNHKHPLTGEFFLGGIVFDNGHIDPGQTARARVRLITRLEDLDALLQFGSWSIWEGPNHVGHARIIELISRKP